MRHDEDLVPPGQAGPPPEGSALLPSDENPFIRAPGLYRLGWLLLIVGLIGIFILGGALRHGEIWMLFCLGGGALAAVGFGIGFINAQGGPVARARHRLRR